MAEEKLAHEEIGDKNPYTRQEYQYRKDPKTYVGDDMDAFNGYNWNTDERPGSADQGIGMGRKMWEAQKATGIKMPVFREDFLGLGDFIDSNGVFNEKEFADYEKRRREWANENGWGNAPFETQGYKDFLKDVEE